MKSFKFFILTPWIYAIGTCSEQINIANRIASSKNKQLIVIKLFIFKKFLKYHVCNHSLFDALEYGNENINKKVLKFIFTILINVEFFFTRLFVLINDKTLNKVLPEYTRFPQIGIKDIVYNDKSLFKKNFDDINSYPPPSVINIKNNKLKKNLKEIFKSNKKKIVCLHVRDSGYRSDLHRRNLRNSNIDTYIPAIEYLIKKNYLVVRLGDIKKNKINFSNQNFIELDNNINDIYLIHNCSFYIGTSSGPLDTSFMLQKPTLLTNAYSIHIGYPRNYMDRVIYKKALLNGKKISLFEHLNLPFQFHDYLRDYNGLDFIDNTSNEILEATKEFSSIFENNNFSKTETQKKFNKILLYKMKDYFYDTSPENCLHQHYLAINFIRWTKTQQGSVCNFFLDNEFNKYY